MDINLNSARVKCDFHHKQNHFFDYFDYPVPDDAVICVGDVPFQYNEREWAGIQSALVTQQV